MSVSVCEVHIPDWFCSAQIGDREYRHICFWQHVKDGSPCCHQETLEQDKIETNKLRTRRLGNTDFSRILYDVFSWIIHFNHSFFFCYYLFTFLCCTSKNLFSSLLILPHEMASPVVLNVLKPSGFGGLRPLDPHRGVAPGPHQGPLTLKEPGYFDPSHSRGGADSAPP